MVSAILLLSSATVGVMAISEITIRQELCRLIEEKVNSLALSEQWQSARQTTTRPSPLNPRPADLEIQYYPANFQSSQESTKAEIVRIEKLHAQLQALMIVGANDARTSSIITDQFLQAQPLFLAHFNFLNGYNSDFLLALALACCGLCGAVVSELRAGSRGPDLKHALLGIAVGFIALLSIKGGKAIFLIEHRADLVVFNPYSSGLLALLAGLYSKRVFHLLSLFVRAAENSIVVNHSKDNVTQTQVFLSYPFFEPKKIYHSDDVAE